MPKIEKICILKISSLSNGSKVGKMTKITKEHTFAKTITTENPKSYGHLQIMVKHQNKVNYINQLFSGGLLVILEVLGSILSL